LKANLNVIVYIDGGLQRGSGQKPFRPNGYLAQKMNSVFVSINYRLNAFGFLALDLLANSNANSSHGNYGLWDVIVAIQWVRDNIKAFGGDQNKITVFGPDGDIIMCLINNSDYSSLINSAWILESKFHNRISFSQQSKIHRKNFLLKTNCSSVDCLINLSGKEVLELFHHNSIQNNTNSLIVFDGKIFFSILINFFVFI